MNRKRAPLVGIIAEDDSDVDAASVLIHRISERDSVGVRRFVGHGCGRIKRKCRSWAENLRAKGCRFLILIHDLDRNDLEVLRQQIEDAITPSPIMPHLVCIPVEEMEAWWLSDPEAIRSALNLRQSPQINGHPERISSPKERLGSIVRQYSQKTKVYLNTKHNVKIAEYLDLTKAKQCKSFVPFHDFVAKYLSAKKKVVN